MVAGYENKELSIELPGLIDQGSGIIAKRIVSRERTALAVFLFD
jgi:hypothetical protein